MPFMEDLYEATHANVQLAVRDGARRPLRREDQRPRLRRDRDPGRRPPAAPRDRGRQGPARLRARGGPGAPARPRPGGAHAADDRRPGRAAAHASTRSAGSGFAWTRDEMTVGSVSVGAPVYGPHDDRRRRALDRRGHADDRRRPPRAARCGPPPAACRAASRSRGTASSRPPTAPAIPRAERSLPTEWTVAAGARTIATCRFH